MTDLMQIINHDPDSLMILRTVADYLGCDRIESESSPSLNDILAVRRSFQVLPNTVVASCEILD
jgi:hypothetical protein